MLNSLNAGAVVEHKISVPPLVYVAKQSLEEILYPAGAAFNEGYLKVSNIHKIWYAEYGNPQGVPVLFVHGGPGGGCTPSSMRFFDPAFYRIILFDQRGSVRSDPIGEMRENTTQDLILDMEKLREHLKIDRWVLFGGSWGSALSILYGEAHPTRSIGFILRGIFLGTEEETNQLWYGMADTFPEAWDEMVSSLPLAERTDLIRAFFKRVMDPDPKVHMPAARAFVKYDLIASFALQPVPLAEFLAEDRETYSLAKAFIHYSVNHFFLEKNQLLKNINKINHLPAFIVHGRFDTILRAKSAYQLYKAWPNSRLSFVQDAGHASTEIGIAKELVDATQTMKAYCKNTN